MLGNKNSGAPRDDCVALDDVIYRIIVESKFTKSVETPIVVEQKIFSECTSVCISNGVVVSTYTYSICGGVENDIFGNCDILGIPSGEFGSNLKRRCKK